MKKAIITVVGKDSVGIIAAVCTYLSQKNINILDITQTIISGYFNMMMIVDVTDATETVAVLNQELEEVGKNLSVAIKLQLEDIFTSMHRL